MEKCYRGPVDPDRRTTLSWIVRGAAALCGAASVLLVGRFVRPHPVRDLSRRLSLGPVGQLPDGGSRHLTGPDVHVIHEARGLYAVSGRCTHLGCILLRRPEGFDCPCHGAHFDLEGHPISGPATRPLTWYRLRVDRQRNLVLHLDQTVDLGTMTQV